MASGIGKKLLTYLVKPQLAYANYKRSKLVKKYKSNHLLIENYSSIENSKIGKHVYLGARVKLVDSKIGDHSYVNADNVIKNTTIGKFCSIASFVKFGLGAHPTDLVSTHPAFYSNMHAFKTFSDKMYFEKNNDIAIGNDVWIGESVTIMGGVTIGDGAIVATGAIVTKDIKPYEIVGGIPAKHIKFRFDADTIDRISKSKWWDRDEKWLEENYKLFLDTDRFIESLEA